MQTKSIRLEVNGEIPVLETSGDYFNFPYLDLFIPDKTCHVYLMDIKSTDPLPAVELNIQIERMGAEGWDGPDSKNLLTVEGIGSTPRLLTEVDRGIYRIRLQAKGPLEEAALCSIAASLLVVEAYPSQIVSV